MKDARNTFVLVILASSFLGSGCEKNPIKDYLPAAMKSENTTENVDAVEMIEPVAAVATTTDESNVSADAMRKRVGELFENVLPTLDSARELVDRHSSLPSSSIIPFKEDQQSNSAAINELLDDAIQILSDSEVSDYRQQIRDSVAAIAKAREDIADFRRQKISAPRAKDQSKIEKVNPFSVSKESLDDSIALEQQRIKEHQQNLVELKQTFAKELSAIGVEVDDAGVDALLSSVSGDDIVTMAVVFDNIKQLTTQLQTLTEESGEALQTSKKYYGMYVVMVQVMDRIQKTFVRDITEKHIPKLKGYAEQADKNIDQAKSLIKRDAGDRETLLANIESNQLTRETAELYVGYLERNAALIEGENKRAQKNLATAMNTYDTVKLSSDVAALMSTGRRDFETLMKLQVPSLREFGNKEIRKEFERLTVELRSGT